jgi:DNA-binding transcriptional ArsR family regulator
MKRPAKSTGMAFEDAARSLAELGHPHRLEIFRLLIKAGREGLSVGAIQGELGIPKSTLAHHIAQLVAVGLMTQSREGRVQRCRVDAMRAQDLLQFLVADCCEGLPGLVELQRASSPPLKRAGAAIVRKRAQR